MYLIMMYYKKRILLETRILLSRLHLIIQQKNYQLQNLNLQLPEGGLIRMNIS